MSSTAGALGDIHATSLPTERQLASAIAFAACALFVALALVMFARRVGGAFIHPLSPSSLLIAAIAAASIAGFLRWQHSVLSTQYLVQGARRANASKYVFNALFVLPAAASVLLLAALTLPGTPLWSILVSWILLLSAEAASWFLFYRGWPSHPPTSVHQSIPQPNAESLTFEAEAASEIPAGLVQQITRVREADGESVHALLRAEVAALDRLAVLHIAFCPPLAARPALTAHVLDCDTAEVRITQAETFGARLEVRLPQADQAIREVLIEVLGTANAPRPA